jgi:isopentenyldiphosphate isomerase/intracellular septation protein A
MRSTNPLLSFLPGFAPILAYIVVESLFGETAGLVAGVALGLAEFLAILAREKRVDAFSLADTVLLVAMGAVSWALSDPVYFRLKPAVSGAVLAFMMILGTLGPHRLFMPYLERKAGLGELPREAVSRMTAMVAGFGFLTLAHSGLTAVAALWWSKDAWNFVAGALFWILSLAYVAAWTVPSFIVLAKRARSNRRAASSGGETGARATAGGGSGAPEGRGEFLPVIDAEGRVIAKAERPFCHSGGEKPLHPVVRLWLADGSGSYWMQKRSLGKLVQPGRWDCAVGGHVSFGETIERALERETREEIGLVGIASGARPVGRFVWETDIERELVFVFVATLPRGASFACDPGEVDEVRLWTPEELVAALGSGATAGSRGADVAYSPCGFADSIAPGTLTELARRELLTVALLAPGKNAAGR